MTVKVLSAADVSTEMLRQGMIAGFSGYAAPMKPDPDTFDFMMRQRGLNAAHSRIAVAEGRVVAIWLVSTAGPEAYLMASGTDPAYRSRGLARRLAMASMRALREAGAERFRTEVMAGNEVAAALYHSLGMRVERDLFGFELGSVRAAKERGDVEDVDWDALQQQAAACRDWQPTWQNDDGALSRVADRLKCVAVRDGQGLAGYAAAFAANGSVAQIAVRPDRRRAGLGHALLCRVLARNEGPQARLVNADGRDSGFAAFMTAVGATPGVRQQGLICTL